MQKMFSVIFYLLSIACVRGVQIYQGWKETPYIPSLKLINTTAPNEVGATFSSACKAENFPNNNFVKIDWCQQKVRWIINVHCQPQSKEALALLPLIPDYKTVLLKLLAVEFSNTVVDRQVDIENVLGNIIKFISGIGFHGLPVSKILTDSDNGTEFFCTTSYETDGITYYLNSERVPILIHNANSNSERVFASLPDLKITSNGTVPLQVGDLVQYSCSVDMKDPSLDHALIWWQEKGSLKVQLLQEKLTRKTLTQNVTLNLTASDSGTNLVCLVGYRDRLAGATLVTETVKLGVLTEEAVINEEVEADFKSSTTKVDTVDTNRLIGDAPSSVAGEVVGWSFLAIAIVLLLVAAYVYRMRITRVMNNVRFSRARHSRPSYAEFIQPNGFHTNLS